MSQQYGCWAMGCRSTTEYVISNPAVPLMSPVETCSAHVGDLLGNVAKSALRNKPLDGVTIKVTPLL